VNRAPAKVQSALLQAMQERQVTIGETTFLLPTPFLVLATQNPIEQEGTYHLPEAQLDRFLMKLRVTYPSFEEELEIVRVAGDTSVDLSRVTPCMSRDELALLTCAAREVYIDPRIDRYVVGLVHATRSAEAFGLKGMIDWGASPRASIALRTCARSLACIRGERFVTPDHVKEIAHDVLRHRVLVSFEAEARGLDSDKIISSLLTQVTVP
jgi:MoxR-like ATPase